MAKAWWIADDTFVTPSSVDTVPGEDIILALDATPLLAVGESVASATAKLLRLDTNEEIALGTDAPSVDNPIVTQRIRNLVSDTTYILHVYATIGTRIQALSLVIESGK